MMMRSKRSCRRNGFTLVELVVVVMILGILAAVAAPKFMNTSAAAIDNGLRQTLAVVRDAIELHVADNGGAFPPCTADGDDFKTALEPYLRGDFPDCPVGPATNSKVEPVTGASTDGVASPTKGWRFNTDDGTFICNYDKATTSDATVKYDEL